MSESLQRAATMAACLRQGESAGWRSTTPPGPNTLPSGLKEVPAGNHYGLKEVPAGEHYGLKEVPAGKHYGVPRSMVWPDQGRESALY